MSMFLLETRKGPSFKRTKWEKPTGRTDDDSNNKTVDTDDTSHNNGNHRLHNQIRVHHTHGRNSDTTLSGTVGSAHTGEDQSGGDSHEAEEGSGGGSICALKHNH